MIIKLEAMRARGTEIHSSIWKNADGSCQVWRPNGACKTWVTRPREFRLPVKYGLYSYGYVTHENAHEYHMADECHLQYRSNKTDIKPIPWYSGIEAEELSVLYGYLNKWADHVYEALYPRDRSVRRLLDGRTLARMYVEELEDLASEVYKALQTGHSGAKDFS